MVATCKPGLPAPQPILSHVTVLPIITLAISSEAWPFVWAVALVLLLLLVFAAVLIGHRRRADSTPADETEAVDLPKSDAIDRAAKQSLPSPPGEQPPDPSIKEFGEEGAPANAAMEREQPGDNAEPKDDGENLDPMPVTSGRGAGESESPSIPLSPQVSETVVEEQDKTEAREAPPKDSEPEQPAVKAEPVERTTPRTSLIERFQRRPSLAVAAVLGAGVVGRYLIRRR